MGAAVNSSVHSLLGFVVLIIVPFNLFKYTLTVRNRILYL